jgi:hypothetical protein
MSQKAVVENVGSSLGLVGNRAEKDLKRFKDFIESMCAKR